MGTRARWTLLGLGAGLWIAGWLWWRSQDAPDVGVAATLPALTSANAPATRATQDPPPPATRQAVDTASATEPQVLAGRVVDARTRAPIPGARLRVRDAEAGEGLAATATEWQVACDEQGAFRQELGSTAVVSIEASGDGHALARLPCVVAATGIEIALRPAWRLVVEVRFDRHADGSQLEPVSGAACELYQDSHSPSRRTVQRGTTDAHGEVVFVQRDQEAFVSVQVPNLPRFSRTARLEPGQERWQVVLKPFGQVVGRVIDKRSRQPLAGATIKTTYHEDLHAVTDNEGRFRIAHDHTDNTLWTVSHPGHATIWQRVFPQKRADAPVPDIELEPGADLVGRIEGFVGAVQWTAVSTKSWFAHQHFQQGGTLAAAGPVRIFGVPPREVLVIEVRDQRGHVGSITTRAAAAGETVDFGTLVPEALATLHGRILGLDAKLPAVVRVQCRRGDLLLRDVSRAVRGVEYWIPGLPAGQAEAWIEQEGTRGVVARPDLSAAADVLQDLDLGGRIRGVVRDEAGVGIAEAVVLVHYRRGNTLGRLPARTDASGRFVCAGLDRAASHSVSVATSWPDRTVLPKEIADVLPGAPPVEFTVRRNTLAITGSVDAAILSEVKVSRLRVQGSRRSDRVSAGVGDDGSFTLPVPDAGPWTLELHAIDESGEFLRMGPVGGVAPLREVNPGDPVVFRRK